MADCKKPRKDAATTSSSKGKGKGTKANPQPKASSSGTPAAKPAPKAKAGAQKRGQSQPKAKAKAKGSAHSAEAGNSEIDWARTALEDSNVATEVFSASLASFAPTDVAATLPSSSSSVLPSDSYLACSFYTTFNPAFHTSEVPGEDGLLSPILDTGATHCLLPLDWLSPAQAATSKRIHLKVASGSSVRALLFNNHIFCARVSRPLLSVGQLKAMLDLRFLWDNSSPCLIACSGGLRYILLEASIMHHLPVITQKEMHVLIEAIHCFTETGELWNAQTWSKKLGKKLALYHWSEPTTVLPKDHSTFTEDPQVNFSSMQSSCASALDLPSSVTIVDITDNDPPTDHEPEVEGKKTVNFAQEVCKSSLPPTSSTAPELCHSPSVNSTLLTTSGIDHDLFALEDVQSSVQVLLDHALPLSKHRTNVVTEQYIPRGRLFGGYTTRGQGITHSTYRFTEVVEAIHSIAKNPPEGLCSRSLLVGTNQLCKVFTPT